ncbi:MAG: hypothetical protein FWF00_06580 [Endomicrobia bacterium]|nr:hypothetical protein [Endomicrobiia bacterium]MCL2507329.1 hypothetical protein [Endomicrobiia bacterium]
MKIIHAVHYDNFETFHSFMKDFKTCEDVFKHYADLLCEKIISDKDFFKSFDFFVYIPSLAQDRVNYSLKLAEYISKKLNIPLRYDVLEKIKPTKELKTLPRINRKEEIENAFHANLSGGENICVIDDVYASGATLNEVSKFLKSSAKDVSVCFAVAALFTTV